MLVSLLLSSLARRDPSAGPSVGSPSPLRGGDRGGGPRASVWLGFSPHSRARDRLYPLTCWRVLADDRRILCSRANGGWGRRVRTTRADPHPRPLPARGRGTRLKRLQLERANLRVRILARIALKKAAKRRSATLGPPRDTSQVAKQPMWAYRLECLVAADHFAH